MASAKVKEISVFVDESGVFSPPTRRRVSTLSTRCFMRVDVTKLIEDGIMFDAWWSYSLLGEKCVTKR